MILLIIKCLLSTPAFHSCVWLYGVQHNNYSSTAQNIKPCPLIDTSGQLINDNKFIMENNGFCMEIVIRTEIFSHFDRFGLFLAQNNDLLRFMKFAPMNLLLCRHTIYFTIVQATMGQTEYAA